MTEYGLAVEFPSGTPKEKIRSALLFNFKKTQVRIKKLRTVEPVIRWVPHPIGSDSATNVWCWYVRIND